MLKLIIIICKKWFLFSNLDGLLIAIFIIV